MRKWFILIFLLILSPIRAQSVTTITSPAPFQVFQRDTQTSGTIWISGETTPETLITGVWGDSTLPALYSDVNGHFEALWPDLPVWQHDLILTIDDIEYTIPNVGIGDVYVIAGQSNAVGAGKNYQMYTNTLGLRAGMLTLSGWRELADPTGLSDTSTLIRRGSQWPLLATYILENGVPVAFIPLAVSGTHISTWQPGKSRFERIRTVLNSLPAPYARAILWQQGEQDKSLASKQYSVYLSIMAGALYNEFGLSTLAAHLWNNPKVNNGIDLSIRGGNGVLAGADLRDLPYDGGIHYVSDAALRAEAWRWYQALQEAGYYP